MFEPMRQNITWHWYITHSFTQIKFIFWCCCWGTCNWYLLFKMYHRTNN